MQRFILRRFGESLFTLFCVLIFIFSIVRITGDPATFLVVSEEGWTHADIERQREALGLDKPIPLQFVYFMRNVAQGDLGTSYRERRSANAVIMERFPNTLKLAVVAYLWALFVGVPMGVLAAVKRDTVFDRGVKTLALLGQSMPAFWVALLLILFFGAGLKILPAGGSPDGRWTLDQHVILPALALSGFLIAGITRITRSGMLDVLDSEYIKLARLKGMSEWAVIWKHALRNALIPLVTLMGLQIGTCFTGAIVIEHVFAWNGIGSQAVKAIFEQDFPVVQASVLWAAGAYIVANFAVDILYAYIDPRIRYETAR